MLNWKIPAIYPIVEVLDLTHAESTGILQRTITPTVFAVLRRGGLGFLPVRP